MRDKSGAEQVLTCSAVAPESPAALPYPGGVTTFEVEMPPAGHQIPFARVEVDGRGAEGWVEEDETIYFDFIAGLCFFIGVVIHFCFVLFCFVLFCFV